MKASLSVLLFMAVMGNAAATAPLMLKEQISGDAYHLETCYFHTNKVNIVRSDGHGRVSSLVRRTNYPFKVLSDLIEEARKEVLEEVSIPEGLNAGEISAFYFENGLKKELQLRELSGPGAPALKLRNGPASRKLINIADFVCPEID